MNERRISPRRKSILQGRIYFNDGRSSFDCTIRDISSTGAKLAFSSAVETPSVIDLYLPNKKETHSAKVMWRRGDEMGVAFEAAGTPASSSDLSQRLQKLEGVLDELGRVLVELRSELVKLKG